MKNYKEVLSEEQIQDVFNELQRLNADYIIFEGFIEGYCIVHFKQNYGETYKSGSILIDENGKIIKIKEYPEFNGFEMVDSRIPGSSLLKLVRVLDKENNPTKYVKYSINIAKELYNKETTILYKEGIYNTVKQKNAAYFHETKIIKAVAWNNELLHISIEDKEGEIKHGIIRDPEIGRGSWIIQPNFSKIEEKDGQIYTFDENDVKKGEGIKYEEREPQYNLQSWGDGLKVEGSILNSPKQLIRTGKYTGNSYRNLMNMDFDYYISHRLFLTDEASEGLIEELRVIRDSIIIDEPLSINDKNQIIKFNINNYYSSDGISLNVNPLLKDIKFEDAFVKHYEYISYLIKNKKIKVDFNVFTEMLQESYITNESPEYSRQTEDDRKKAREGGYEIKNKYFKDLIIYERDNINNVLTKEQSEKILEYINDTYTIIQNGPDKLSELEGLFVGELCVITLEVECYPYNSIKLAIIVKKDGTFIDDNFSEAKIINKEYILYTKLSSDFIIDTKDRDSYYEYETIKEQGILNSNLEVIYKGELGDIEKVKNFGDFLILEKSKFTDIEKEKIRQYITYELNNDEIMDCTDCGSDAIWDQSEECFVCEECGNRFYDKTFRPNEDWWLTPFKLSAAEDFKDMLKHPSVSDGLFLIEKYQNEYYDDWEMENSDWDYDDSWETETEEERNKFIDAKLYAVFSIKKKDLVFPFQELKINIKGRWDNQEIYLKDESWISYEYKYQKNLSKIEWYADSEPFDRQEYSFLHIINSGERFFTIFDKFHNGEYVGQTLASVFNKYSEKVIELQTKDLIFIGTNALHQLYQKFGTTKKELLTKLIRIRDFKLDYQDRLISSIDDSIIGKIHSGYKKSTFGGIWPREEFNFYEGRSIKDIVKEDPLYIKGLIKGRNIIVSYSFKSDLEKNSLLDDQLKAAIDYNIEMREQDERDRQDEIDSLWEEEERRWYENEGYRDAFDNDPDAEWNID